MIIKPYKKNIAFESIQATLVKKFLNGWKILKTKINGEDYIVIEKPGIAESLDMASIRTPKRNKNNKFPKELNI